MSLHIIRTLTTILHFQNFLQINELAMHERLQYSRLLMGRWRFNL